MGRDIHNMHRSVFNAQKLKMLYKLLIFASIGLAVMGQLFLKRGMMQVGIIHLRLYNLGDSLLRMFTNISVIAGVLFFGASTALWMVILSNIELSYAYPMVSIGYVVVALSSRRFFKEKVSFTRWLSIAIICTGVILVTMS